MMTSLLLLAESLIRQHALTYGSPFTLHVCILEKEMVINIELIIEQWHEAFVTVQWNAMGIINLQQIKVNLIQEYRKYMGMLE
jgi:hypothetical protein